MTAKDKAEISEALRENLPEDMLFQFMYREYREARQKRTFWDCPDPESWNGERKRLRDIFLNMFGPFPEKVPLNARMTASCRYDGFTMECVRFVSCPGVEITANLYIPDTAVKGKTPAAVLACGHSDDSKSYYRYTAHAMAKAGILTLCFDPTGQGERFETWNYCRWQGRAHITHDRMGAVALLLGDNLAGIFAWDCIRAVDYLLSRTETDPERIGFMGTSGGGTQTTWAATLDDRITVAVPCCFITSIDDLICSREPNDSEQNPPGLTAFGLEYRDMLAMMAPKPVLVLAKEEDFFPVQGAADTVRSLKKLYALYGAEERVELYRSPGRHAGRGTMAVIGVQWLCRWFGLPVPEGNEAMAQAADQAAAAMQAVDPETFAAGGQLMFDRHPTNYWSYLKKRTRAIPEHDPDPAALKKILAIQSPGRMPAVKVLFSEERIRGGWLETEKGIQVPWLYLRGAEKPSGTLCVLSHEDGMMALQDNGREGPVFLDAGMDLLLFDPRGVGLTRGASHGWWAHCARTYLKGMKDEGALPYYVLGYVDPAYEGIYATNNELAMHGIKLNRPVLGQRVLDTLAVLDNAEKLTGVHYGRTAVYGSGYSAAWMLYGTVLCENKPDACVFSNLLASFKMLCEEPEHRYSIEQLARGILTVCDLPDALRALGEKATVLDPVNSIRFPLYPETADRYLKGIRTLFSDGENPVYVAADLLLDRTGSE